MSKPESRDHILHVMAEAKLALQAITQWNEADSVDANAVIEMLNSGIEARKHELNRAELKAAGQGDLF